MVRGEPRRARRGAHERRGGVREVREGGSAEQGRAAGGVPGGEWAPFKSSPTRGIDLPPSFLPPAPEPAIHRSFSQEKHPRRPPARWLADVAGKAHAYNGFNLVVGDSRTGEFAHLTNRGDAPGVVTRLDRDGPTRCARGFVHGLSNAGLNTPWPKVRLGCERMRREMERVAGSGVFVEDGVEKRLVGLAAKRSALPTRLIERVLQNPGGGVDAWGSKGWYSRSYWGDGHELDPPPPLDQSERAFVKPGAAPGRPEYGTRCSTAIAMRGDSPAGEVNAVERSLEWDEREWVETAVAFDRVPPPPVPADPNAGRREPDGTFLHTALDDGW